MFCDNLFLPQIHNAVREKANKLFQMIGAAHEVLQSQMARSKLDIALQKQADEQNRGSGFYTARTGSAYSNARTQSSAGGYRYSFNSAFTVWGLAHWLVYEIFSFLHLTFWAQIFHLQGCSRSAIVAACLLHELVIQLVNGQAIQVRAVQVKCCAIVLTQLKPLPVYSYTVPCKTHF